MVDFADTFSRFMTFMIFTTFYDLFWTDADEEVNKMNAHICESFASTPSEPKS